MPAAVGTTVFIDTILFQTDAPDIVLSRDVFGTTYLCVLTTLNERGHHYIAVPISSDRLAQLREGTVDLRTAMERPETTIYFSGWLKPGDERLLDLDPIDELQPEWIPGDGFLLSNFDDDVANERVVQEALDKNAAVIVCGWDPPESRGTELKIDADHLVKCISDFQLLVKRATMHSIQKLKKVNNKARFSEDAYALQVFGVSPGSFNVHFRSKDHANLIGTSIVGSAMTQIDELMELARRPPDDALAGLRGNKGLILAAYQNIMEFVAENEVPFKYRWSQPAMASARGNVISPAAARSMSALLKAEATLQVEPFVYVASFTSVNTDRKPFSWTAHDVDDKIIRGLLHEDYQDALDGVTIKSERYTLAGEERLVSPASGRPSTKLFLKSIEKLTV